MAAQLKDASEQIAVFEKENETLYAERADLQEKDKKSIADLQEMAKKSVADTDSS